MEDHSRVLIIREDTVFRGEIRNGRHIEVFGYVEGDIVADKLTVQPSGRCFGKVKVGTADIRGQLQGDVVVTQLINVRNTGQVSGHVKYGKLAMEMGGSLTAEMRNIPPSLSGDLDLAVDKGRAVRITLQDLSAIDPDNTAAELIFTVSQVQNGFLTLAVDPGRPVHAFTQADLEQGAVLFHHDGTDDPRASFAVVVADSAGATSGAAQTVNVAVRAR